MWPGVVPTGLWSNLLIRDPALTRWANECRPLRGLDQRTTLRPAEKTALPSRRATTHRPSRAGTRSALAGADDEFVAFLQIAVHHLHELGDSVVGNAGAYLDGLQGLVGQLRPDNAEIGGRCFARFRTTSGLLAALTGAVSTSTGGGAACDLSTRAARATRA